MTNSNAFTAEQQNYFQGFALGADVARKIQGLPVIAGSAAGAASGSHGATITLGPTDAAGTAPRSPDRLRIAKLTARFLRDAGIMREGFSFQAGSGGIALAFVDYLREMMQEAGAVRRDIDPQVTAYVMNMMAFGLVNAEHVAAPEDTPSLERVVDGMAEMLERALRPDDGGNTEASKQIIRQVVAAARAQLDAMREKASNA